MKEIKPDSELSAEELVQLYIKCNEGLKKAQQLLIEEFRDYQQQIRDVTIQFKQAKGLRLKPQVAAAQSELNVLEIRLLTLTHIANSIAWQMLSGEIHLVRRLHMRETEQKFLDSSNVAHAIESADSINKNLLDFALLSDLTNTIQIGDLLVRRIDSVEIIELKEGKVNDKITKILDTAEAGGQSIEEIDFAAFDSKTAAQARRMVRQRIKKLNAEDVMRNDFGTDPITKLPITVSTPTIETEYYHEELAKLREQLKLKTWAYTCIEGCVHIGMYRGEGLVTMAPTVIKSILEGKTKHHYVVDWLQLLDQVAEPVFAKLFDQEFILDFLTSQVKIIIGLDLDALMHTFNVFGLQTEWMTTKETSVFKNSALSSQLVDFNNKGIKIITPNDTNSIQALGKGVLSKIVFDNIYPSNIALTILNSERPSIPESNI